MLAQLLAAAQAAGAGEAWLFASVSAPFFLRQGFHPVARYEAPPVIMATKQATSVCPITAQIMTRKLPG
jgi:N-acetylglutamate synthase-like GNAT family acetyltransferase